MNTAKAVVAVLVLLVSFVVLLGGCATPSAPVNVGSVNIFGASGVRGVSSDGDQDAKARGEGKADAQVPVSPADGLGVLSPLLSPDKSKANAAPKPGTDAPGSSGAPGASVPSDPSPQPR